jgi:sarcosine oxidase/L-pipecolate oxidase
LDPIKNLDRLKMKYRRRKFRIPFNSDPISLYNNDAVTKNEIEAEHPFRNLPEKYKGLYAPDDGVINLPLLLRTLYRLAGSKGARLEQGTAVKSLEPAGADKSSWHLHVHRDGHDITYNAKKIIITSGAYVNHILHPSFGIKLRLDIWEMVASYFSVKKEKDGKPQFPCRHPKFNFQRKY